MTSQHVPVLAALQPLRYVRTGESVHSCAVLVHVRPEHCVVEQLLHPVPKVVLHATHDPALASSQPLRNSVPLHLLVSHVRAGG